MNEPILKQENQPKMTAIMGQKEVLNIDENVRILVRKAVDKYPELTTAAAALGVNKRTLSRYKKRFDIY